MSNQPEAMRLADALAVYLPNPQDMIDAAAELRRLYAENEALQAENAKLHGWFQAEAQEGGRLQRRLNGTENQRDALLKALRAMRVKYGQYACRVCGLADAAIKAVEEGK